MRSLKEELVARPSDCAIDYRYYQQILNDCLPHLSEQKRVAIYLRFWLPESISYIAGHFNITWEQADHLIDSAIEEIRTLIKGHRLYKPFARKDEAR